MCHGSEGVPLRFAGNGPAGANTSTKSKTSRKITSFLCQPCLVYIYHALVTRQGTCKPCEPVLPSTAATSRASKGRRTLPAEGVPDAGVDALLLGLPVRHPDAPAPQDHVALLRRQLAHDLAHVLVLSADLRLGSDVLRTGVRLHIRQTDQVMPRQGASARHEPLCRRARTRSVTGVRGAST